MDAYIFQFTKKLNSTLQPNVSILTPYSVQLKGACTILNPVIEVFLDPNTEYTDLVKRNYAYIPDFGRYYYINNWTLDGALAVASLETDPLASFKTDILNSSQYVLRSSVMSQGAIVDNKYPILTSAPTISFSKRANPLQPGISDYGCFVVGILNDQATFGGLEYYVFSYTGFMLFRRNLFNLATQWGSDTTIVAGLKKAITDPFQYVCSCIWLPYSIADFVNRGLATQVSGVNVGYDVISMTAYVYDISVLNIQFTNVVSLTVPKHPQATTRGSYLNTAPYTRYFLSFYPFCGMIELDTSWLTGSNYLFLVYTVDLRSGKGILSICSSYSGTSYADWAPESPLRVIEAQIGVEIPLTNVYTALPASLGELAFNTAVASVEQFGGFMQMGKKIAASAANLMTSAMSLPETLQNAVSKNIGAEPFQIGDVAKLATNVAAMNSKAEISGSQGTISLNSRMPLQLYGVFYYVADEDNSKFGRPLCQSVTLSALTGFVQCDNPHITLPAYAMPSEVAEIENYLSAGLYIE